MEKMLSALDQFISLDYPFRMDERMRDFNCARCHRQSRCIHRRKIPSGTCDVQTEAAFGRTNETYPDTIEIGGVERDVNVVRIGRVSLMYQTTDRQVTGAWDNNARQWVSCPPVTIVKRSSRPPEVVSNLDAPSILFLPVSAPEAQ